MKYYFYRKKSCSFISKLVVHNELLKKRKLYILMKYVVCKIIVSLRSSVVVQFYIGDCSESVLICRFIFVVVSSSLFFFFDVLILLNLWFVGEIYFNLVINHMIGLWYYQQYLFYILYVYTFKTYCTNVQ